MIAIGPVVMMKFVCQLTREYNIPTVVSMNPIMIDGTGMCGGCRLLFPVGAVVGADDELGGGGLELVLQNHQIPASEAHDEVHAAAHVSCGGADIHRKEEKLCIGL